MKRFKRRIFIATIAFAGIFAIFAIANLAINVVIFFIVLGYVLTMLMFERLERFFKK